MIVRMFINTLDGIALMFLKMVPDSILIPRIEAQIARKEEAANRALEELGTHVARFERQVNTLEPLVRQKEAEIQNLVAAGKEDLAAKMMQEFEELETDYLEKKTAYESGLEDLQVSYKEAQLNIAKLQKQLSAIKSESARSQAQAKLNDLRKAVSEKRFDAGGLTDDINLIKERVQERGDRVKGTRMVLDMASKKTASQVADMEAVQAAGDKARLARFAASRNIALKGEKVGAPTPLGESAPEEKAKA